MKFLIASDLHGDAECTRKLIGKKAQEGVREGEILIISLQDKWQVQAPGDQGRLAGDGYAWWCTF